MRERLALPPRSGLRDVATVLAGLVTPCLNNDPCTVVLVGSSDGQPCCCRKGSCRDCGGLFAVEFVELSDPDDGGCASGSVEMEWAILASYCAPTVGSDGAAPHADKLTAVTGVVMDEGWRVFQTLAGVRGVRVRSLQPVRTDGCVGWTVSLLADLSICSQSC